MTPYGRNAVPDPCLERDGQVDAIRAVGGLLQEADVDRRAERHGQELSRLSVAHRFIIAFSWASPTSGSLLRPSSTWLPLDTAVPGATSAALGFNGRRRRRGRGRRRHREHRVRREHGVVVREARLVVDHRLGQLRLGEPRAPELRGHGQALHIADREADQGPAQGIRHLVVRALDREPGSARPLPDHVAEAEDQHEVHVVGVECRRVVVDQGAAALLALEPRRRWRSRR